MMIDEIKEKEKIVEEDKVDDPEDKAGADLVAEAATPADAGTAPETESKPVELNNTTVPTPEEEEAAGVTAVSDEESADTAINAPSSDAAESDAITEVTAPATAGFTQSQVNELIGKTRIETRDKTLRSTFARYGVNSEEELDDLFGDAQRFGTLQEAYDGDKKAWGDEKASLTAQNQTLMDELNSVKERIALLESGIDKERYDDAKFILKGKGLELTVDNINAELATHPEWKRAELPQAQEVSHFVKKEGPETKLSVLGNVSSTNPEDSTLTEREMASKLWKTKL